MEYLPTIISSLGTIICAIIAGVFARDTRKRNAADAEEKRRSELRSMEGRLQLEMLNANTKLCIGTAMAVKNGHANGELEEGLNAVRAADKKYTEFLERLAVDTIRK